MAQRSSGRPGIIVTPPALAFLLLIVPAPATAMCMSGDLWAWPPSGTTIPTNPHILLEGYGTEAATAEHIARHRPALVGSAGRVPLRVVETNVGGFALIDLDEEGTGLVQVVLAPTRELPPGTRWTLRVAGADRPATWKIAAHADSVPPIWSSLPLVAKTVYRRHGCGPEAHVDLAAPASDDGGLLVFRATVRDARGALVGRYLVVPSENGLVEVGHGMCSGAFALESGAIYSVGLTAVDLAGNEASATRHVKVRGAGPADDPYGGRLWRRRARPRLLLHAPPMPPAAHEPVVLATQPIPPIRKTVVVVAGLVLVAVVSGLAYWVRSSRRSRAVERLRARTRPDRPG